MTPIPEWHFASWSSKQYPATFEAGRQAFNKGVSLFDNPIPYIPAGNLTLCKKQNDKRQAWFDGYQYEEETK